LPRVVGMLGPKCEREGIRQNDHGHRFDVDGQTPLFLPFIGGVVLAVPCRVPQNILLYGSRNLYVYCGIYINIERGQRYNKACVIYL